jgi:hypothetical protein
MYRVLMYDLNGDARQTKDIEADRFYTSDGGVLVFIKQTGEKNEYDEFISKPVYAFNKGEWVMVERVD